MDTNTSPPSPVKLQVEPEQPSEKVKASSSSAKVKTQSKYNFSVWQAVQTFLGIAIILATIFTLWTPANLFSNQWFDRMFQTWQRRDQSPTKVVSSTQQKTTTKIGIVAGHSGSADTGAVCDPPLDKRMTEVQLNTMIAKKVVALLEKEGYQVDLLEEFDPLLPQYKAYALVSIHTDSCKYVNDQATGYKVAAAKYSAYRDRAERLSVCLWSRYGRDTKLKPHYGSVTNDMTDYHAFEEIHTETTAAIIEIGFLNLDYDYLVNHSDEVAQGIANGILCYTRNEDVSPVATQAP